MTELYCLCRQPYSYRFMVECDCCHEWFHGECVQLTELQSQDILKYHCPECSVAEGPSVMRRASSIPALFMLQENLSDDVPQSRSSPFGGMSRDELLSSKHFGPSCAVELGGHELTQQYVQDLGFARPIFVKDLAGLEMQMPSSDITVQQIATAVGDRPIEVMDVNTQDSLPDWTLDKWATYYTTITQSDAKTRQEMPLLNVISMEFSDSPLGRTITRPRIVRQLDWIEKYWPPTRKSSEFPKVQLYCLMSPRSCWTDFHVDFGGTSVFYHVLRGGKRFLMIPPTQTNLRKYERWCRSDAQQSTFFADMVDDCYDVRISAGNTMFIPAAWIHAVYTTDDSIVIGGNFLHGYAMREQLDVYQIEDRCDTPNEYRFPYFETLHWYAVDHYSNMQSYFYLPVVEQRGVKRLLHFLAERFEMVKRSRELTSVKAGKSQDKIDFVTKCLPPKMKLWQVELMLQRVRALLMTRDRSPELTQKRVLNAKDQHGAKRQEADSDISDASDDSSSD